MDITPYVDSLRRDLLAAAEAGGPEVSAAAERLGYALESATRLALMEALSHATAEITASMPAGGVDGITLRLPESLKARAEEAAAASGTSLNTWLVQAVRAATHEGVRVDIDLSSLPFFGGHDPGRRGSRRMTGWV